VNLTRYQVEWCAYGLRQAIALAQLTPARVRPELPALLQQLDDLLLVTCDGESESISAAEESRLKDPINVAQAAEILECSPQWVRQIAKDLGGRWTGSSWVFDRQTVLDYAERRER
jgi:hypothetical protein